MQNETDEANFTREALYDFATLMGDVNYKGPNHMLLEMLQDHSQKPIYHYSYR